MPTGKVTKASDKAQICKKLVSGLHKLYGKSLPRLDMPVLETFIFAICLEDNGWDAADAAYKKLIGSYFDLNEIRVTSVLELEEVLHPLRDADWKGLRIRSILRYVFESTYTFEFEKYRRLTQEVAVKTLKKVPDISPFVRDFSLQHILGSHIVCLDASMLKACQWLGIVPVGMDATAAGEHLKPGLKKSDVAEFCYLIRSLATDPKYIPRFDDMPEEPLDMEQASSRLLELQSPPKKPAKPTVEKKATAAKNTKKSEAATKTTSGTIAKKQRKAAATSSRTKSSSTAVATKEKAARSTTKKGAASKSTAPKASKPSKPSKNVKKKK